MSNKNILAVVLSIFSVFQAIGCENHSLQQPSGTEIAGKIVKKGCLGGCAGLILAGLKIHCSGRDFSKEDTSLFYVSGVMGLGGGLAYGAVEAFLDHKHRIYNSPVPGTTTYPAPGNKTNFEALYLEQVIKVPSIKDRTITE